MDFVIVLDYVSQPADFPTMKARGVSGAVVYVAPASWSWPKTIKASQLRDAQVAGFPLAFNFEQGTQDYLGGYSRGQAHGAAIEQALRDLGLPASQPCYLSVDTSVYPASFQRAREYFQGARSTTHHPLDFYGENALGEYLVAAGLVTRLWMSESTSFPGNQAPTAHVALQQHYGRSVPNLGGSYDVNDVIHADWGQYPRPAVPAPRPEVKVHSRFNPPLNIVDSLAIDGKGAWGLGPDGGVFTWAGSFHGSMAGLPAFAGRKAARIVKAGAAVSGAHPPLTHYPASAVYEIIAESGERYLPTP